MLTIPMKHLVRQSAAINVFAKVLIKVSINAIVAQCFVPLAKSAAVAKRWSVAMLCAGKATHSWRQCDYYAEVCPNCTTNGCGARGRFGRLHGDRTA